MNKSNSLDFYLNYDIIHKGGDAMSQKLAIVCAMMVALSGCATTHRSGGGWLSTVGSVVGPADSLRLTIDNQSPLMVAVYIDGDAVRNSAGVQLYIQPFGVVTQGFAAFFGRDVAITIKGICPPKPKQNACEPGDIVASETRMLSVWVGGRRYGQAWEIPRGWGGW